MSEPYVGEIRMFAGNYAPQGWLFCEGQLLPVSENEALFALLGATYGGDGETTFALPDLRGRLPIDDGAGFALGSSGGDATVTLSLNQIPSHTHSLAASTQPPAVTSPEGALLGPSSAPVLYLEDQPTVRMNATAVTPAGGGQAHTNLQPYLCVNFIISLFGIFPPQP